MGEVVKLRVHTACMAEPACALMTLVNASPWADERSSSFKDSEHCSRIGRTAKDHVDCIVMVFVLSESYAQVKCCFILVHVIACSLTSMHRSVSHRSVVQYHSIKQVETLLRYWEANHVDVKRLWLDIEGPQYWMSQPANQAFYRQLVDACSANKLVCGVYVEPLPSLHVVPRPGSFIL